MKSSLETFSSLDRKQLQALLSASLVMLLKTYMMVVIRGCFFVRGSVNTSPRYATLEIVKWINIQPGGQTSIPSGRYLLRMWKTVSMKVNFIKTISNFHQNRLI
jgi:hypothetical protein